MSQRLALALARLKQLQRSQILEFKQQEDFVDDPSQFIVAQCTRRGGKTNALALKFKKAMDRYPGSLSRYIALTRDSAKDIMWPVLIQMNETHNWNATFTESDLTMTIPNNASLRLFGADMKNFIDRLKGAKSPAVAVDEAQNFKDHIRYLVDDVLTPTIMDYDGSWLALTGTPGPVPRGLFYEAAEARQGGYSVHKWTLYDNPYLPHATKFVADLKAKKGWTDDNPTYLREWQNKWVIDLQALVIKYAEALNDFIELPPVKFNYILGVDIGHNDADALALIGWSERSPNIFLIEECVTKGQDITELTNQIESFQRRYDISKIVIDTGGLGKKIAEEITRRKHIPVMAADKVRKMENIAFLNEWLRLGKFKAKASSRFAADSYHLQIDHEKTTPDRLVIKSGFHSDIIDAVLYAFKESPAFTYREAKVLPRIGTPEWGRMEEDRMEQEELERLEAMANEPDHLF